MEGIYFLLSILSGLFLFNSIIGLMVIRNLSENYKYSSKVLWKFFFFWSYAMYLEIKGNLEKESSVFPEKINK